MLTVSINNSNQTKSQQSIVLFDNDLPDRVETYRYVCIVWSLLNAN